MPPSAPLQRPRERADAARNRLAILHAAERLFTRDGPANVTMDAIAEAAGVGKPTLYRRFGDRSGLARALLEERERAFQEEVIRGRPPIGPGAPPAARLEAFLVGFLRLLEDHLDVLVVAESSGVGVRYRSAVYAWYHAHVAMLLREGGVPPGETTQLADVVLAPAGAELYRFQRAARGLSAEDLEQSAQLLVQRILGPSPGGTCRSS